MTLGERIRKRRTSLGLTQQELAKALGVTPQHISAIEQDKRSPSLSSLANVAEQLGVSAAELISEGPEKRKAVVGIIPAIMADKKLSLKTKRVLVSLVEELYQSRTST